MTVRADIPRRRASRAAIVAAVVTLAALAHGPGAGAAVSPISPFGSWDAFVARQHGDLTGSQPTAASRATTAAALAGGTTTPGQVVADLRGTPDHLQVVDPTVRLYRAYLLRIPDQPGLDYWIARRRSGSWSLRRISDYFAASSEFTSRYGSLSNRAFVELIYDNVLERPYDQEGLSYWTQQLDRGLRSRGAVMVLFSESVEYKRKQSSEVTVSTLIVMMLRRTPDTAEFADAVARLDAGTSTAQLAAEILASAEYVALASRPLAITTATLPSAAVGQSYTATVAAVDGIRPHSWSATGLPAGLTIAATTGVISGRPTAAGTRSVTVKVTPPVGPSASKVLTLAVLAPPPNALSSVAEVQVGAKHSCARRTNGQVVCWGRNTNGQLGNGGTTSTSRPTATAVGTSSALFVGAHSSCARASNQNMFCWGAFWVAGPPVYASWFTFPGTVAEFRAATALSLGAPMCRAVGTGAVSCWGALGGNATSPGLSGTVDIGFGTGFQCALMSAGTVRCWGSNQSGQLGDGTTTDRSSPVTVVGVTDAVELAVGNSHACARLRSGSVRCWGSNWYGEVGRGTIDDDQIEPTPVAVTGLSDATDLTAGNSFTCAVRATGTAVCWGLGNDGQLGDGTTGDGRPRPGPVSGLTGVRSIDAGPASAHVCAVLVDGSVRCWGSNLDGQLGIGSTSLLRATPAVVLAPT